MTTKYKVWLHLEEITLDEEGNDVDYKSVDDITLPLPVGEFEDDFTAEKIMHQIYNDYWPYNQLNHRK